MLDFNKAFSVGKARARQKAKKAIRARALASCEGKVSFDTFTAAKEVAEKRRKQVPQVRRPYHCYYCRKYHLAGS